MKRVRLGVLGAGRIGQVHAENVAFRVPGAELVLVADPNREAAAACGARTRALKVTEGVSEAISDADLDAVVIATPTDTHASLIVEAARAGKHIFCEKPIDFDLEKIDRALAEVERAGVIFQVGFNRRFDPSFQKAREVVSSGRIGQPHLVRLTSRDPKPPPLEYVKVSGGLFTDMTIHDFDMARWILGDEVLEVQAMGANLVDPRIGALGDIDTALINLRYRSGALGVIDNSRRATYGYDVRFEVHGSDGAVWVGNSTPTTVTVGRDEGVRADGPLFWFVERFAEAYVREMSHFVECVAQGRQPDVSGRDGRLPLLLARAANRSLAERRTVAVEG